VTLEPWDFDFEFKPTHMTALARSCGLTAEVVPLGEGWDHASFLCDGHVLRVPKRRDRESRLRAELAFLLSMPDALPLAIPRPRPQLASTAELPYACMVYEHLAGSPLDDETATDASHVQNIGAKLGNFLQAVHVAGGSPTDATYADDNNEWVSESLQGLDRLRTVFDHELINELHDRVLSPLPEIATQMRACHGDLWSEHILVDHSAEPVAVIDWGDVTIGPWWLDFVGLWKWGGDLCLESAFAAYGLRCTNDEQVHLECRALMAAIGDADYEMRTSSMWEPSDEMIRLRRLLL
jgi:aminoglycoside phosphotransferase (APT) family kinase protein